MHSVRWVDSWPQIIKPLPTWARGLHEILGSPGQVIHSSEKHWEGFGTILPSQPHCSHLRKFNSFTDLFWEEYIDLLHCSVLLLHDIWGEESSHINLNLSLYEGLACSWQDCGVFPSLQVQKAATDITVDLTPLVVLPVLLCSLDFLVLCIPAHFFGLNPRVFHPLLPQCKWGQ